LNRLDEYKAKKEEYEKLIKDEEARLAASRPDPLFLEHLFYNNERPQEGPMWAKVRPLVAADFLAPIWKTELPGDWVLKQGRPWTPMLTCTPVLKTSLVEEVIAKGGNGGHPAFARLFMGNIYRCSSDVSGWDGKCSVLSLYLEKADKVHLGRYKTEDRRREIVAQYETLLEVRADKAGQEIFEKYINSLNKQIEDWAKSLRDKLHNQALISLLDPDNWVGGAEALIKEVQPNAQFFVQVKHLREESERLTEAIKEVLLQSIKKNIKDVDNKSYPKDVKDAVLAVLEEKGTKAIPYDPFFVGSFPRRRHSS
jgi:hypothetical protein